MPTVGWILEGNTERFLDATDRLPELQPTLFACPFCADTFQDRGAQQVHVSVEHPIERPVLFLRGRAAPAHARVRTQLARDDVSVLNCTCARLKVDGAAERTVTAREIEDVLVASRRAHVKIALQNDRPADGAHGEATYSVGISVPDRASLDGVDAAFRAILTRDDVDFTAINEFSRAVANSDGVEYSSALGEYVTGILIKDGRGGAQLPAARFIEKLQPALEILKDFDRPLPRVVAAAIRFSLNDFRGPHVACPVESLDASLEFFVRAARGDDPLTVRVAERAGVPTRVCPIDRDTEEILGACTRFLGGVVGALVPLSRIATRGTTTGRDRAKIGVLLALGDLREGLPASACLPLQHLANDPMFGPWARACLAGSGS